MLLNIIFASALAIHATASHVPIGERDGTFNGYQGPGQLVGNLNARNKAPSLRPRTSPLHSRAVDMDKAKQLLGPDSIVDCPPNGMTNWDSAVDAATLFVTSLGGLSTTVEPGFCLHKEVRQTIAQICNKGTERTQLTAEQAQIGFDLIEETCTSKKSSGTIRTSTGIQYALYAKVGVGRGELRKRGSGRPHKRCINSDSQEVTGCVDSVCTPAISLNESGDCPNVGNDNTDGCSHYCEIQVAKYYGVPEVYDDTRYCAVSRTDSKDWDMKVLCTNPICVG